MQTGNPDSAELRLFTPYLHIRNSVWCVGWVTLITLGSMDRVSLRYPPR